MKKEITEAQFQADRLVAKMGRASAHKQARSYQRRAGGLAQRFFWIRVARIIRGAEVV